MEKGQFVRVGETARTSVTIRVDGQPVKALAGDTLLTALLVSGHELREAEFDRAPRAGFCLMGACQDCWVFVEGRGRRRACTTLVDEGLKLRRRPEAG